MRRALALGAALAVSAAAAPAGSDGEPGGYAVRLPVQVGRAGRLQALAVPPAAYAAARTRDLSDLRVFDARGRAMPMARGGTSGFQTVRLPLRPVPILGPAQALTVREVTLEPDGIGGARVARARATVGGAGGDEEAGSGEAGRAAGSAVELGVLLDARSFDGQVDELLLEASVPSGQPVTFTVEASRDLSSWRPLGERTVFRADDRADRTFAVPLGGAAVRGAYLRATWRGGNGRLLTPVRVSRAELGGRPRLAETGVEVCADAPPPADPHRISFAAPSAIPIRALRITPAADDALVPVRVLGRDTAEQPWTPIGAGTASRGGPAIRLADASFATLRLEAAAASPGFTTPPTLCFAFAPRTVLFLAAGKGPYALAIGRAGAASAYLSGDDLRGAAAGPASTATTTNAAALLRLASPDGVSPPTAKILWAVLLLGTALLAGLVWLLWRRSPSGQADD